MYRFSRASFNNSSTFVSRIEREIEEEGGRGGLEEEAGVVIAKEEASRNGAKKESNLFSKKF